MYLLQDVGVYAGYPVYFVVECVNRGFWGRVRPFYQGSEEGSDAGEVVSAQEQWGRRPPVNAVAAAAVEVV